MFMNNSWIILKDSDEYKDYLISKNNLQNLIHQYPIFQYLIEEYFKIKRKWWIDRHVYCPETDLEHVIWMIELCDLICPKINFDTELCKKICTIHEAWEIKFWDTTPFDWIPDDFKSKEETRIAKEILPEELFNLFLDFEKLRTKEWKFVFELDKAQSIIKAYEYECTKWYNLNLLKKEKWLTEYSIFLDFYNYYFDKWIFENEEVIKILKWLHLKYQNEKIWLKIQDIFWENKK